MKNALFLLALLVNTFLFAQKQNPIDSLEKILVGTESEIEQHRIYLELLQVSIKEEETEETPIIERAVQFSKRIKTQNPEALLELFYLLGSTYFNQRKITASDKYLAEALVETKGLPDSKLLGNIQYQIAYNHQYKGEVELAVEWFDKAIKTHKTHNNLKEIARCHNHLGTIYRNKGEIKKALQLLNESLELLQKEEDAVLSAAIYNSIGRIYKGQAKYDSAHYCYKRCLDYAKEAKHNQSISTAYNNLGNIEQSRGNLGKALENYLSSLAIKEAEGNARGLSIAYHNVGSVRYELKSYQEAESDFNKSMDYALQSNFKILRIHNHRKLGDVARVKDKFSEAIKNHEEAVRLSKEMDFKAGLAENYLNLGYDYLAKKEAGASLGFFRKSLTVSEAIERKRGISLALAGIAEAYVLLQNGESQGLDAKVSTDDLGSIESLLLRSHQIARETNDLNSMTSSLEALISYYKKKNNYKQEALYAGQYIQYRDSLFDQQTADALANWQTKYKTTEKEKEIILLEKEKQLTEKEKELLSSRNRFYSLLALGLFSFLLVGAYLFFQLRKTKRQIESKNQTLRELNTTKDKFFGIIAHDIRSPIVALDGVGEQMDFYLKKDKKDKLERLAQRVDSTAKHLGNLLDNLLNWALSQQGIIPYKPRAIELAPLVNQVISMFQNNADSKNIHLKTELDNALNAYADEAALNTILRNLIGNAIKFTPRDGTVLIQSELLEKQVSILVKDTGVGMSKERLSNLFSLEKQSQKGTAGEKGTGLGLTLVKELVDLNGGAIKVNSTLGKGSTFEVLLPCSNE